MPEKQFVTGVVVELKSGGKKMTIREYDIAAPSLVSCYWHDDKGEPQTQWYQQDMLVRA